MRKGGVVVVKCKTQYQISCQLQARVSIALLQLLSCQRQVCAGMVTSSMQAPAHIPRRCACSCCSPAVVLMHRRATGGAL